MAMRKSKKKLPRREDKMIDVEKRIEARVFDRATLKVISKFMSKKLFDRLDNPIKMGKEANVFRGVKLDKNNKQPMKEGRLTDEKWREMLENGEQPDEFMERFKK